MGGNPRTASTLSVWRDAGSLYAFTYQTVHKQFYDRKDELYDPDQGLRFVMWHVADGHLPTISEALERFLHLEIHGNTDHAFGWDHLKQGPVWRTHGSTAVENMMKTKTRTLTLPDVRPALLTGVLLIAALLLSACSGERRAERVAFDGQFFRASTKKVDRQRQNFEVSVRPVSASLEGAREAGRYEATRYCVGNFGSSDIAWTNGPDAEDGRLRVDGDRLLLTGTCAAQ